MCELMFKQGMFFSLFADTHRIVLSLISCFAGGVFLAACLLDIIPDYLSDIKSELDARQVEVRRWMERQTLVKLCPKRSLTYLS